MWPTVLILALAALGEPVRVGVIAILVSLPRPMRNLLAYWLGLMTAGLGAALIGVFVLRDFVAPINKFVWSAVHSPVAPSIQIALGVLALSGVAMIVRRSPLRAEVPVSTQGGASPVLVEEPLVGEPEVQPSGFARLSWTKLVERGSVWMSFAAGLSTSTPPLEFWGAVMAIAASGAAVGTQVTAAVVFVLVAFGIAEIPLVGYLAFPTKTQAVVMQVHGWMAAHRRQIMIYMFGLFGIFMLATGVGNF